MGYVIPGYMVSSANFGFLRLLGGCHLRYASSSMHELTLIDPQNQDYAGFASEKPEELAQAIAKGIPAILRGMMWQHMSVVYL